MAERICPFCGKTNPADAEFCWSCQARLVPTSQSIPEEGKPSPNEELADWLKQTGQLTNEPQAASKGKPEEEVPEWLKRVRERARLEKEAIEKASELIPEESSEAKDETPDWLKEFQAETGQSTSDHNEPEANQPVEEAGQPAEKPAAESTPPPSIPEAPVAAAQTPRPEEPKAPDYIKPFHTEDLRQFFMTADESQTESENAEQAKGEPPSEPPAEGIKPKAEEPGLPDWLQELEAIIPPEPGSETLPKAEPPEAKPVIAGKEPSKPEPQTPAGHTPPFTVEPTPDWLEQLIPPEGIPASRKKRFNRIHPKKLQHHSTSKTFQTGWERKYHR